MVPVVALAVALVPLTVAAGQVYRPVVRRAYPPLQRRLDFVGAAPLVALECPSDLQDCPSITRSMSMCCPKSTKCVLSSCCPTNRSCAELVATTPACSDPKFELFTWKDSLFDEQYYFCCNKGEVGYLTKEAKRGSEACGKAPVPVASSLLATPVSGSVTLNTDTGKTVTSPPTPTTVVTTAPNGDVMTVASTIPGVVTVSTGTADAGGPSGATPRSSLPTAATAGIAVGVVGGLVLLGLAVWLGIRHGKKVASASAATAAAPAAGAAGAAAGGSAGGAAAAPVYTAPHPVPPEQKYDAPPQQQHQPVPYTSPTNGVTEKDGAGYYHSRSDLREMDGNGVRSY